MQTCPHNIHVQILPNPNDIKIFFNYCIFKPLIFLWWRPENHWRPWGVEGCQRQLWPGNICQLDYVIQVLFSIFFPPVFLSDPAFWLARVCKCRDLETADPDCAAASVPATESQCNSEQQFEIPGILPLTDYTPLPQFPLNIEGSGLLLFAPFQL